MRVQSFLGKVSIDGLNQLDTHINEWLKRRKVTPTHVTQSFGQDKPHDGRNAEPIIVVTVWYEAEEEDLL